MDKSKLFEFFMVSRRAEKTLRDNLAALNASLHVDGMNDALLNLWALGSLAVNQLSSYNVSVLKETLDEGPDGILIFPSESARERYADLVRTPEDDAASFLEGLDHDRADRV